MSSLFLLFRCCSAGDMRSLGPPVQNMLPAAINLGMIKSCIPVREKIKVLYKCDVSVYSGFCVKGFQYDLFDMRVVARDINCL